MAEDASAARRLAADTVTARAQPGRIRAGAPSSWVGSMVITESRSYLLVIGEAAALAWVLAERRMAFPMLRRSQAEALEIGDELLIYTTRTCFHNPTRDTGRVAGLATVKTAVRDLAAPVMFGERSYVLGCGLDITGVAPLHAGVELRPLIPELHVFPDSRSWSAHLRRPLVPLDRHDAALLIRHLSPLLEPLDSHLDTYKRAAVRNK